MPVGGLSLESMLAMVQAQSAQRAQQARQAQQTQQAQQQMAQQTQQTMQQGQQAQAQQPGCQSCDLAQATARNDAAGQQWGEFKHDDAQQTAPQTQSAPADATQALYAPTQTQTSTEAPAAPAVPNAEARQPTAMERLRQENPHLRTNHDLINHCYKQGGGTWEGASREARALGTSMGSLIRDRGGQLGTPSTTAPSTTAPSTTAPSTTTPSTTTPSTTAPRVQGVERPVRGFREVDVNRLRSQLPPQAQHLAQAFVDSGRRHNVDPLVLAAISKHETGNFTSSAFRNKNNAMGISNSRGPTQQPSHEASVDRMARLLGSTTSGPYRNAQTIGQVARIYAPIGAENDPRGLNNHWAGGVSRFADDFERRVGAAPQTSTTGATAPSGGQPTAQTTAAQTTGAPTGGSGQNGTAQIQRTQRAGQRNQMVEGSITVNGNTYQFRSGGHGRGSLPPGQYQVTRHLDSRSDKPSMMVDGVGYSFALSDKFDARVGGTRSLLRIHPDGRSPGTEGCIGIVGDGATQRRFREDMLAEIRRNGGSYTLNVQ